MSGETVSLASLWLPILVSVILSFFASFLIWGLLDLHGSDLRKTGDEEALRSALGAAELEPGAHAIPRCADKKEGMTEQFQQKLKDGPVAYLSVMPNGVFSMPKMLGAWTLHLLVVIVFAAYVTGRTLPAGAHSPPVFRIVGAVSFAGFSLALLQLPIWWGK